MKDLQRQLGLIYLFISHNLAVIYQMSDRIGVMYRCRRERPELINAGKTLVACHPVE